MPYPRCLQKSCADRSFVLQRCGLFSMPSDRDGAFACRGRRTESSSCDEFCERIGEDRPVTQRRRRLGGELKAKGVLAVAEYPN